MRLRTLFITSHVAAAVVSGGAIFLALRVESLPGGMVFPLVVAAVLVVAGSWLLARHLRRCLQVVLHAAAKGDRSACPAAGIQELDDAAHRLCEHVQRWSEAATAARQQARDAELLLSQLDRRAGRQGPSPSVGAQLRQVLGGITSSVDTELCQIVSCTNEIAKCVQEIADGAEEQNDAIAKTTTYVEQISANIDAVTRNAENARQAVGTLRNAASDSVSVVQTLIEGMDRIRANVSAGERKLRVLNDQAREIAAIIESIAAISSRTDLLALNASIESVRAGEHGRGFAVVAEEVHKLAEQAAQASRDAAALIHSTQLETHESIADLNDERARVEHDFQRVKSAREALEQIIHIASDSAGRVGEISHATEYQLQLAQDVVLAVERIANVAKGTRSRAEKACWTTKTLSKMARQFDTALVPLRRCLDPHPKSVLGTDLQEVLLESGESPAPRPKPIVDLGAAPGGSALHVTHAG